MCSKPSAVNSTAIPVTTLRILMVRKYTRESVVLVDSVPPPVLKQTGAMS